MENLIDDNIRAIERIKDREFVEQLIPTKACIKEAIDIFYIVNASGVNLTDAELALAQISGYWPQARATIKEKINKLEKEGWVLNLDFMMYVLLGVMHNLGSKMEKLHTTDNMPRLEEVWNQLDHTKLDYVLNIMKTYAYIDHSKEINSVYALIPIIVFAFNKGKSPMTQQEIKKAIKWFYYSQIRQRYISQLPQKLDKDLRIISSENSPFDKMINLIEAERKLEIDKDEFIGVGISHPLWGLMKWYFKSQNAVCLSTGISIRKNMGKKYELEYDHIFPYSVLAENGYDLNNRIKYALAQEITNRAVLTSIGNRTKFVKSAEGYLSEVKQNFPNSLALQCIPEDEFLWKLENYEKFLEARRILLAKKLNSFLEGLTKIEEEDVTMDIYDLIQAGENHEVEFKTTLRYDMKQNTVNKKLEQVILKTIAAFSNSQGGTLIIGVNDDMQIIGLDNDYSTLREGTKDGFEIHLRNLINQAYGVEFASTLKIMFPVVDDKEMCTVEIQQGKKPLFTEVTEETGIKSEKFYLRSGNSSPELPVREIATYIRSRFDSYFE
ncbi:MAG: putative DNA binding domain-containing protein [Bacteroidetes bacterium]|nr:putative DNA binding domain-containing protein [Bacteroidota bacterium]